MAHVVMGVFADKDSTELTIEKLRREGLHPKDMSIVVRDQVVDTAHHGSRVVDSAASGMATGSVIGGIAGLLIGVGAIAIPGIGGVLIGGPIAAALGVTGAAATAIAGSVTGALAGGLLGVLVGMGIPEDEARMYEESVRAGAILLVVPVGTSQKEGVIALLEESGAEQVRSFMLEDSSQYRRQHLS